MERTVKEYIEGLVPFGYLFKKLTEENTKTTNNMETAKPMRIVKGTLMVNDSTEGETLEQQVERMISNKEPIKDGSQLIYTERTEGVKPEMNIRTDRFEIAINATDKISRSYQARRQERHSKKEGEDAEGKPLQGTEGSDGKAA